MVNKMKEHRKLSELALLVNEKVNPSKLNEEVLHYSIPAWKEGAPQLVHSKEVESTKFLLPENAVLVSRLNPSVHKTWVLDGESRKYTSIGSTEWAVVVPHDSEDLDYLHAALESPLFQHQMEAYVTGTTNSHQRVRPADFLQLTIPNHDKESKTKIGVLSKNVRQLKEGLEQTSQKAEEIFQRQFSWWFLEFGPSMESVSDSFEAKLFPATLEESKLGPIPAGWQVVRLGDIATLQKGLSYKGDCLEDSEENGLPMFNLGCFGIDGTFRREKMKYYSGEYRPRHVLNNGDLLIANTDMTADRLILGSTIIVPESLNKALFTHHTYCLRLNAGQDERLVRYVSRMLSSPNFRYRAEGFSTGATVLAMPKDALMDYHFVLPSKDVLEYYYEREIMLENRFENALSIMTTLDEIRDKVIPGLLSGGVKPNK